MRVAVWNGVAESPAGPASALRDLTPLVGVCFRRCDEVCRTLGIPTTPVFTPLGHLNARLRQRSNGGVADGRQNAGAARGVVKKETERVTDSRDAHARSHTGVKLRFPG